MSGEVASPGLYITEQAPSVADWGSYYRSIYIKHQSGFTLVSPDLFLHSSPASSHSRVF